MKIIPEGQIKEPDEQHRVMTLVAAILQDA
jgi:hypothetical protein